MLFKSICVSAIILVAFCIAPIRSDVSHILLGAESPVDAGTMEVLKQNISDYLLQLEHGGSPQMHLVQIFGTVYKVNALLETPDGSKNCEIHVLEKPWIDFCQVRVTCENGGHYEVTLNPNQHQELLKQIPELNHLSANQYLPPVVPVLELQQPSYDYSPPQPETTSTTEAVQQTFEEQPYFPEVQANVVTFPEIPEPINPPPFVPEEVNPPIFEFHQAPQEPFVQQEEQHFEHPMLEERVIKGTGIPRPIFPQAPEIDVLPFEQLPQGPELQVYKRNLFDEFMSKYERHYIDEPNEREYRYKVFEENFNLLQQHSTSDRLACQYSITEFSDLTTYEYYVFMGYDSMRAWNDTKDADIPEVEEDDEFPEKYDQRDENLVTRVKFQGDCGACWAYVTAGVIEGLCAKRIKKLQEFSEQSLIDCDNSNFGCKGGTPPNALKHIAKRGGLELESKYPTDFGKSKCKFDKNNVRVKVSGAVKFKKNDEEGMARWLFKNGPIAVGINADPLQFYKRGVINPTPELCSPKKINHGIILIGYGVEVNTSTGEKLPYWIIQNQWGTRFGENGFYRLARNKNACGISLWANSAKLADTPDNCQLEGVY